MPAYDHNKGIPPTAIELERQQLAAISAFEALVAQPSYDWALHQLREIGRRLGDGEPVDPWIHAIVALGKRNILNANECLSMIGTVWDAAIFRLVESDGEDRFYCGSGTSGLVRAVRRPRKAGRSSTAAV